MAMKKRTTTKSPKAVTPVVAYGGLISGIGELLETARHSAVRVVNSLMTVTYWEVGRRIVEFEHGGKKRAEYGEKLLRRLAEDLTTRFGKGVSPRSATPVAKRTGRRHSMARGAEPGGVRLPRPHGAMELRGQWRSATGVAERGERMTNDE